MMGVSLKKVLKGHRVLAMIQPFIFRDEVSGDTISVSVSPEYSKIAVNNREYFFIRETGEFDGIATVEYSGPILIYAAKDSEEE
jgi:hypothetical protein